MFLIESSHLFERCCKDVLVKPEIFLCQIVSCVKDRAVERKTYTSHTTADSAGDILRIDLSIADS